MAPKDEKQSLFQRSLMDRIKTEVTDKVIQERILRAIEQPEDDANSDDGADSNHQPRRWEARPCDKCTRCGQIGHWASECTAMVCGNCNTYGHLAHECPKPAPCFRCGELGHWSKRCPHKFVKAQSAPPAR